MKLGVLGGTFDPVHNAHLMLATLAAEKMELDKVIFVPANQTPLKERDDVSPTNHRLRMIQLAIKGKERFEICKVELKRPGVSYTVDTIAEIKRKLNIGDGIYFIMGWDSLLELPEWKKPQKLIQLCRLVVFNRQGVIKPDLQKLEKTVPGLMQRVDLLQMTPLNISSTTIRYNIKRQLSIRDMVPPEVEQYIREHKLYQ